MFITFSGLARIDFRGINHYVMDGGWAGGEG